MDSSPFEQKMASDAAEASLADYRAFNPWPYLVVGLGVVSSASLISPFFSPLAVAAVALGIWTASQEDDATPDAARLTNGIGIALGLFFLSLLASHHLTRNWSIKREADEFAKEWFDLLRRGELEKAHQLSLTPKDRQVAGSDLKRFYEEGKEARQGLQHFYADEPLKRLKSEIAGGTIRFDLDLNHERNTEGEYVDRQYSLVTERGGVTEVLPFRLVLRRTLHPDSGTGRWQVYSLTEPRVKPF